MPYLIPLVIYLAVSLTWARIFRRVGWSSRVFKQLNQTPGLVRWRVKAELRTKMFYT